MIPITKLPKIVGPNALLKLHKENPEMDLENTPVSECVWEIVDIKRPKGDDIFDQWGGPKQGNLVVVSQAMTNRMTLRNAMSKEIDSENMDVFIVVDSTAIVAAWLTEEI